MGAVFCVFRFFNDGEHASKPVHPLHMGFQADAVAVGASGIGIGIVACKMAIHLLDRHKMRAQPHTLPPAVE